MTYLRYVFLLTYGLVLSADDESLFRALQFPPEGWLRISLANTSITWLVIRPNGRVVLKALGDIGHLSPEKITYS
jgi:hypothetical protein